MLLSDLMEKYRGMFMKNYQTELFSHYTINPLTWEVFKKCGKIYIKLLSDYCIHNAFDKMKRGGLCGKGSLRYAIGNNKYKQNYDERSPPLYIMHYDINRMYAYIMANYKLPYDDFWYFTNEDIKNVIILDHDETSEYIYYVLIYQKLI